MVRARVPMGYGVSMNTPTTPLGDPIMPMISDETPILESVFVTHAPEANDISDIAIGDLGGWFWSDLSYAELAEWTQEIGMGADGAL